MARVEERIERIWKAIREFGRYIKYAGLKELRAYPVLVSQWCLVFGVQS